MTSTTKLPNIRPNQGNATSLYSLEHSPLVRLYMGLDATGPEPGGFGFKAALSHAPERPLTVMNDYCVLREGKSHARKCDISAVRRQLKDTMKHRKSIMNDFTKSKELAATDIRRMREAYHTHLDHLANKKVSKKQLVAAMQANSTA